MKEPLYSLQMSLDLDVETAAAFVTRARESAESFAQYVGAYFPNVMRDFLKDQNKEIQEFWVASVTRNQQDDSYEWF